jgi:hypothetical protein
LIDTREQNGPYIQKRLQSANIETEIVTLSQETGADYIISGEKDTMAVQRKVVCSEFINELDEIVNEIAPRLLQFGGNPAFLIEENFEITKDGYLQNQQNHYATSMSITSYYGILETLRHMGLDVYCTRDLNASIWWMIAVHGYLNKNHYPKHRKYFSMQERAIGMMTVVPGLGATRAEKALQQNSIRNMASMKSVPGLTEKQGKKLLEVLRWQAK